MGGGLPVRGIRRAASAVLSSRLARDPSPAQDRSPIDREPTKTRQVMTGTYVGTRGLDRATPIERTADLANSAHGVLS